MMGKMSSRLSRRAFLKLGGLSLGCLAFRLLRNVHSLQTSNRTIFFGRVTVELIYVYSQPSFKSERIGRLRRDRLVWIFEELASEDSQARNNRWYRIAEGYAHSAFIQRLDGWRTNAPLASLPAGRTLGEITTPYARAQRYTSGEGWQPLYRLYYQSVHEITGIDEGPEGEILYRITDYLINVDYHIPALAVRLIPFEEYSPLPTSAAPDDKRIVVSLFDQALTAYEGEQTIFQAKVSTGIHTPNLEPGELPTDTPTGSFRVRTKFPSRHMGDGKLTDDILAYELPGVPWTMIFQEDGIALHGAYWHNNFGARTSHGCINLRPEDAKWLFRWTDPPFDGSNFYQMGTGTLIQIV
jgi:hypothetical protein